MEMIRIQGLFLLELLNDGYNQPKLRMTEENHWFEEEKKITVTLQGWE